MEFDLSVQVISLKKRKKGVRRSFGKETLEQLLHVARMQVGNLILEVPTIRMKNLYKEYRNERYIMQVYVYLAILLFYLYLFCKISFKFLNPLLQAYKILYGKLL